MSSNLDQFISGLEEWTMGDVEVEVKVNQDDNKEAAPEVPAEEPVENSELAEDVADEGATEEGAGEEAPSEEATLYANFIKDAKVMLAHLKKKGWDTEFVTRYNQHGRMSKTLGLRVPSLESLKNEPDARNSAITYAAIGGMEVLIDKLSAKLKAAKKNRK